MPFNLIANESACEAGRHNLSHLLQEFTHDEINFGKQLTSGYFGSQQCVSPAPKTLRTAPAEKPAPTTKPAPATLSPLRQL